MPIIEHADVRRMLLDMKSRVEGIRALAIKLAHHQDHGDACSRARTTQAAAYHQGQVDLLVPLVKAYGSDQAFRVCETAIQTYGGAGFTRDYPVEQYCRDAKIFSHLRGHEPHPGDGPRRPQARCRRGGANLQAFLGDVAKFVAAHGDARRRSAPRSKKLGAAQEALDAARRCKLLMWFQTRQARRWCRSSANRFLEMMSELAVAWLLLEGAVIADDEEAKPPDTPTRVLRGQDRTRRTTSRATCCRASSTRPSR